VNMGLFWMVTIQFQECIAQLYPQTKLASAVLDSYEQEAIVRKIQLIINYNTIFTNFYIHNDIFKGIFF